MVSVTLGHTGMHCVAAITMPSLELENGGLSALLGWSLVYPG